MLFLHGYLSGKESFYYQTECLSANGFRVVAPDFPGFGASSPIEGAWSVGDYARWLRQFIAAAGLNKPHIVAHSFGARVAFKLLSVDNVADKLVITGGAGLVKERSPRYIRRVKTYRAVKKFFPKFAERHFGSMEYRSLSPVMKESYKKIVNEDLRFAASKVKSPTLLIYGADDGVTPYGEEGAVFHACMSGSNLVQMHGGHFCFCEHPDEFNALCLDFFTEK